MTYLKTVVATSLASIALISGCAATVPQELRNAREAYRQASSGPAAESTPAELHVAGVALAQAEASFSDEPDSYQTRDLAYVAQRKSELATAKALILREQLATKQAKSDFVATQSQIVENTKADLSQTNQALAESQKAGAVTAVALRDSERTGKLTTEQLAIAKAAQVAAEKRATDAQLALAKLGGTREDPRGMVITLSGSVLFASNQTTLLPEARSRLDQVVAALLVSRERKLVVEGYTDSRGTDAMNLDLSQRRAEAVRKYVVDHGYEADLVVAQGFGEGKPIADNESAEGRANNRRVEIVVMRPPATPGATVTSLN